MINDCDVVWTGCGLLIGFPSVENLFRFSRLSSRILILLSKKVALRELFEV